MRIRTTTYRQLRAAAPVGAVAGAAIAVFGMFLGWFQSGSRMRNSFEMFRIPQQLGLEGFTGVRVVWFLMPVLAAGVVGFLVLGRREISAGLVMLQAVVSASVAAIVLAGSLETGVGVVVTLVGSLVGFAAGVLLLLTRAEA